MIPMQHSLTQGPITKNILLFALPLMFGNLLQQMYNIADTWVVGRFLGADALAAVGSSYTLMTFLTSILLGLCMGSGAAVSMQYGSGETEKMRQSVFQSFLLIAGIALVLNLLVYLGLNGILWLLRVPAELCPLMKDYLLIIFLGIAATFLYNYFANLLRAIGNSVVPLAFLAVSAILNVVLDLLCVIVLGWGVAGAAGATVFSQYVSDVGIFVDPGQSEIIAAGVHYLRIEGACYIGVGILFLLYGYYRAVNKPMMSVILTIASLGTRVALAYLLSATPLGVTGIWLSVPIGWALADAIGIGYYFKNKKTKAAA